MKLYKYAMSGRKDANQSLLGFMVQKKVDEFNVDGVKVMVSLGAADMDDNSFYLYDTIDYDDWKHLSDCFKIARLSKREVKKVTEFIKNMNNDHYGKIVELNRILEEIE